MKKERNLINKVNCLLKRIGAPTYINKYGPKKYTLAEKVYALFLRSEWQSSFRRTVYICKEIDMPCPSKSTLQYILKRIPWQFVKNMLKATVRKQTDLAAIDGSSLSRSTLSEYYTMRAGINIRERKSTKLSIMTDTRTKKILSARVRKKSAHDIRDVKYLIKYSAVKPKKIVADRGYDAEWFRDFLDRRGIGFCIPTKGKVVYGYHRKRNKCDQRTYRRRPMVENSFFRLKQLFGRSVNCVLARTMRAEIFLRIILYNLSIRFRMI
jgi:transposase